VAVLAAAAHFWSTAGEIAIYRPEEPSRLYAAPLTLSEGAPLDRSGLAADLESLGYRPVHREVGRSEFQLDAHHLRIGLRQSATIERSWLSLRGRGPAAVVVDAEVVNDRFGALRVDGGDLGGRAEVTLGRPLLYTYYGAELRECRPVHLGELPPHAIAAVLAAEDASFYQHSGVAPSGIARAAWHDVQAGSVRQGGSTITQQLVKNLFVGSQRTLGRKLREVLLAVLVEARTSKKQVLEAYLNEIYWGSTGEANVHGIGAAARAYFGKEPRELTLAEAATLAGMIRSPTAYSPVKAPDASRTRRDWVLDEMVRRQFVSRDLAASAKREPLVVHPLPLTGRRAPWFALAMANEARTRFGVERLGDTGYRLLSTLSSTDQAIAERDVREGLAGLEQTAEIGHTGSPLQSGLVSLEPESGKIRTWVGGRDWRTSQFDHVSQARRQAGSAFKPVVYAAALMDGRLQPWELLHDSPVLVRNNGSPDWRPQNDDGGFRGDVTAAQALALSLNVPTVRVAARTGFTRVAEVAQRMGIESPMDAVPSLALGTCEVTPLELATAYATLASSGRRPSSVGLEAVVDEDGESVLDQHPPSAVRVMNAETAYQITTMLRGVLDWGTGASARRYGVRGPLAGKTGTTDDRRDNWFAGYSADRVTVVWVGYDDNAPTRLSGSRGALPLWSRFVAAAEPSTGWVSVGPPPSFVSIDVDPETGQLATPYCPRRVREELPVWRAPLKPCELHSPQPSLVMASLTPYGVAPSLATAAPTTDAMAVSDGSAEFIAGSGAPRRPARGEVLRLTGQGTDIQIDREAAPNPGLAASPGDGL
jgi:penicillin-binding protein 1B